MAPRKNTLTQKMADAKEIIRRRILQREQPPPEVSRVLPSPTDTEAASLRALVAKVREGAFEHELAKAQAVHEFKEDVGRMYGGKPNANQIKLLGMMMIQGKNEYEDDDGTRFYHGESE